MWWMKPDGPADNYIYFIRVSAEKQKYFALSVEFAITHIIFKCVLLDGYSSYFSTSLSHSAMSCIYII